MSASCVDGSDWSEFGIRLLKQTHSSSDLNEREADRRLPVLGGLRTQEERRRVASQQWCRGVGMIQLETEGAFGFSGAYLEHQVVQRRRNAGILTVVRI